MRLDTRIHFNLWSFCALRALPSLRTQSEGMHEDAISIGFGGGDGRAAHRHCRHRRVRQVSFSALSARKAVKEAHEVYKRRMEGAAANATRMRSRPTRISRAPTSSSANSYDNLYKPSGAGDPENDGYMQKAIEAYKVAAREGTGSA